MGTWSYEPFGNDYSCDWTYRLIRRKNMSLIESTLKKVFKVGPDDIDPRFINNAVGAIEVLAKMLGQGTQCDAYTEDLDEWVKAMNQAPSPKLLRIAKHVIEYILQAKELYVHTSWIEKENYVLWLETMCQLHKTVTARLEGDCHGLC